MIDDTTPSSVMLMHDIIRPNPRAGKSKTGSLSSRLSYEDIVRILGFKPNVNDDVDKVKHSWGFSVGKERFGIWDYKRTRWSTWGNPVILKSIFGDYYRNG